MTDTGNLPTRAIIAEDDEPALELLHRAVNRAGFDDVRAVDNAEDALAAWHTARAEGVASFMLLDVYLPGSNGIDVAEEILAIDPGQLVVLVSARLDEATTARARRTGVHACVSKATVTTELPTMLRRWVDERANA